MHTEDGHKKSGYRASAHRALLEEVHCDVPHGVVPRCAPASVIGAGLGTSTNRAHIGAGLGIPAQQDCGTDRRGPHSGSHRSRTHAQITRSLGSELGPVS